MKPIDLIILMFIIQVCSYIILDKFNLNKWKYLLLVIGLILDFFVLPNYFIPEFKNREVRCGMPALGITLAFWIFGGGTIITTHIIYMFISILIRSKNST